MKNCLYCKQEMPSGKKVNAKYCSDACRVKAWRRNHGISDPFCNVTEKKTKSYTCCSDGRFYSPAGEWGKTLICDNCGTVWEKSNIKYPFKGAKL